MRKLSSLQVKKYFIKGCSLYEIQVLNSIKDSTTRLEDHPILRGYKYVFPQEVLGLPPRRHIDFLIELVLGEVPMSRAPYQMSTPELFELKLKLKEMFEKGYIWPSVSPRGTQDLFVSNKDGTLRLCIDYR
jgi:hypothetical protein